MAVTDLATEHGAGRGVAAADLRVCWPGAELHIVYVTPLGVVQALCGQTFSLDDVYPERLGLSHWKACSESRCRECTRAVSC